MPPDSRADGPCGPKARRTRGPASPGQRTAQPFGGTLNASPLRCASGASVLAGIPQASRRPPPCAGHRPSRAFRGLRRSPYARGLGPAGPRRRSAASRRTRGIGLPRGFRRPPAGRRHAGGIGLPRAFRGLPPPAPALTSPQRAFPASRLAASAPAWYTVRNPCTKEDAMDDRFPALPASAARRTATLLGWGLLISAPSSAAGRDLAGHRAQRLCHLSRLVGRAGLLAQSFHLGRRGPAHRLQRPAGGVRPRGHAGRARLYGGDALRLVCQALRAELSYHRHL